MTSSSPITARVGPSLLHEQVRISASSEQRTDPQVNTTQPAISNQDLVNRVSISNLAEPRLLEVITGLEEENRILKRQREDLTNALTNEINIIRIEQERDRARINFLMHRLPSINMPREEAPQQQQVQPIADPDPADAEDEWDPAELARFAGEMEAEKAAAARRKLNDPWENADLHWSST